MISLIFASDPNGLIGSGNDLPWYYPEDLQYFKAITLNKKVIMGFNTFKSILERNGKPLPNRINIVATRKTNIYPGIETTNDLIEYLKNVPALEEVFVIGGKIIFETALPFAKRIYQTHIKKTYSGDIYFNKIDYTNYQLIKEEDHPEFCFSVYERRE